jgi:hypothetical protein
MTNTEIGGQQVKKTSKASYSELQWEKKKKFQSGYKMK